MKRMRSRGLIELLVLTILLAALTAGGDGSVWAAEPLRSAMPKEPAVSSPRAGVKPPPSEDSYTEVIETDPEPVDLTPPSVPGPVDVSDPGVGGRLDLSWGSSTDDDLAGYYIYRGVDSAGDFSRLGSTTRTRFRDSGLRDGVTYFYRVTAFDRTGNESGAAEPASGSPHDSLPPAVPGGLTVSDPLTGTALDLAWTANNESDLAGYNVYRDTSPDGAFEAKVNPELLRVTDYEDSGLTRNTAYVYKVEAVDHVGNRSALSEPVTASPVDKTPPAQPGDLTPTDPHTGTAVNLSWKVITTADDLAGYNLYRSAGAGKAFALVNLTPLNGTVTDYHDAGLPRDQTYWYYITAVDKSGNESVSGYTVSIQPVDLTPPARPVIYGVGDPGTGTELVASWAKNSEDDLAGYNLYRSMSPSGTYQKVNSGLLTVPSYRDKGRRLGESAWYKVSAVDRYGNESTVSGPGYATPTDKVPPPAPGAVTVSGTGYGGSLRIDWTSSPAPDVAGYNVWYSSLPGGPYLKANSGVITAPSFIHYGLTDGVPVYYRVSAVDLYGNESQQAPAAGAGGTPTEKVPPKALKAAGAEVVIQSAYQSPHGNFVSNSSACASCHSTHVAAGPGILSRDTETDACFYCHDGTQAQSNIAVDFSNTSGNISRHPVVNTPAVQNGLIKCSDCHNPHGDKKPGGTLYPKLLRSTDGTEEIHQGNGFCLACHGSVNRNLSPTYFANTAGDHTNVSAAHYNTNFEALVPSSGTQVTCVQCHDRHAAPVDSLMKQVEENACFACHNSGANSMGGRSIRDEFNQGYKHDIAGETGAKVECSSCHGPHTVSNASFAAGGNASQISNPRNTKQDSTQVAGSTQGFARVTAFCLACHDGTPPQATTAVGSLVPYTITFQNRAVTTNAGSGGANSNQRGWDKSSYTNSVHYAKGIGCDECHNSHGSPYPLLVSRAEDTNVTGSQGICGRCHSGNPPAQYATAQNVFDDLTSNGPPSPDRYRHPTLYNSGSHSDTEDYSTVNVPEIGKERHAECLDCHDPHNERAFIPTQAPAPVGPLRNVSGVTVNFGSVTWDTWNPAQGSPTMTLSNPIANQFELCLKCHTSFSWASTPPAPGGTAPDTDSAREFNPNNPSFHAVIGQSKIGTFTYEGQSYRYGKFSAPTGNPATRDSVGNPWTATSRMYCEDCHLSDSSGLRGPHGSSYWYILRSPWDWNSGSDGTSGTGSPNTADHLCFNCHDYNFYASGGAGSVTERSAFSGPGSYNLHAEHQGRACTACHVTVAHGWKIRGLLANRSSASSPAIPGSGGDPSAPSPYYDGSLLYIRTWKEPGAWTRDDCGNCHSE